MNNVVLIALDPAFLTAINYFCFASLAKGCVLVPEPLSQLTEQATAAQPDDHTEGRVFFAHLQGALSELHQCPNSVLLTELASWQEHHKPLSATSPGTAVLPCREVASPVQAVSHRSEFTG